VFVRPYPLVRLPRDALVHPITGMVRNSGPRCRHRVHPSSGCSV
jgi:hypothetical protein